MFPFALKANQEELPTEKNDPHNHWGGFPNQGCMVQNFWGCMNIMTIMTIMNIMNIMSIMNMQRAVVDLMPS